MWYSAKILRAVLICCGVAMGASSSIRDIDFRNFVYPAVSDEYPSVPSKMKWITGRSTKQVAMRDGRYTFACDDSPCPLLTLDGTTFGVIEGLSEVAAVVMTYHTGGSATWQYLYIIAIQSGKPQVMAWLVTGSRADMGLRRVIVDRGDLALTVNDPEKRDGDCCSSGTITFRYKWRAGSFRQVGGPVHADDPVEDVPPAAGAPSQQVRPSFDCAKAITPTEQLICSDAALAQMDNAMTAAYRDALERLPAERKIVLRREHSEWFTQYSRDCNAVASERARWDCVVQHLAAHTKSLESALH